MGFEVYKLTEEKYQADVVRLDKIAVHVYSSTRGSYLRAMADAWLEADSSDKRILKPAWEAIIVKYSLEAEVEGR